MNENNGKIVLRVEKLSKSYGSLKAVDNLSFKIYAGEIVGLLGPNGAGKTTTLKVLSTMLSPLEGHFSILGASDSKQEEIRKLIGVLPEKTGFPKSLSGEEYLTYFGQLYGLSKKEASNKTKTLLNLLGLENVGDKLGSTYSHGMGQRLSFARALINDPKILLLDEPTFGFDPKGQKDLLNLIKNVARTKQVAILLSSHLLEVVEEICSKVIILNQGKMIASGSIDEIKKKISFSRERWRIKVSLRDVNRTLMILSKNNGVKANKDMEKKADILISLDGNDIPSTNEILKKIIREDVEILAFSQEQGHLSDAFLSITEENK